jgi:alpha-ribazole phosphatase
MEVYLVRHTETVCPKGICYGQSDVSIIEPYAVFSVYNEAIASRCYIFSPLQRCTLLANYIKENLGCISIKQDDRLMEMNFGDWENEKLGCY